ncbi:MAG TPA: fasciclin domain-containing protein [Allosphingosinicella sp.]|uniref:fasciclin domain-containing protein n=1 Tax=Allosphingosinicella sp. TaxID=2823234 RepID=UPI002ED81D20
MSRMRHSVIALAASALLVGGCQREGDSGNQAAAPAGNQTAAKGKAGQQSIGQTLGQSGDHSSLVGAVKAAGLEATLSGSQPYTLFAPTNAAFQKVPNGQALLQPDQKAQLTSILTYHIVPGVVTAEDLGRAIQAKGKAEIATMGGVNLTATREGDAIVVTDAKGGKARVTQADQLQSNGVIHSVDTVLMPS